MKTSKISVITDYDRLDNELKTKLKLEYPNGFSNTIIEFTNNEKITVSAIRWETSEKVYLLRLSKKMLIQIMEDAFEYYETI